MRDTAMNNNNTSINDNDKNHPLSKKQDSINRAKELLTALLEGDTPVEIKKIISDWFKSDASDEAKYKALEKIFDDLTPNRKPTKKDYDSLIALHQRLGLPEPEGYKKEINARIKLRKVIIRVAAVLIPVLFLLGGAYFWERWGLDSEDDSNIIATEKTVSATGGTDQKVLLADDSQIDIKSGSLVRYPEDFSRGRRVFLSGEAMFRVARVEVEGAAEPFRVVTDHVTVTVLGTEFRVVEYPESGNTTVALYSGRVEVLAAGATTQMTPGECFEYNHITNEIRTTPISVSEMISGGYKPLLMFRNARLEDIIRSVEENYNVKFIVPDGASLSRGRFSADFGGEPIGDVLELMNLLDDIFAYRLQGDKVIMSNK